MDEPASVDVAVWSPESSSSEGRGLEIKDEEGEEDRWRREELGEAARVFREKSGFIYI